MKRCNKFEHTDYQPTDEQWKCPNCGSDNQTFLILDSPSYYDDVECECLHTDDDVICDNCNSRWTGKELAKEMTSSMVKCECCNGTGFIEKEEK